MKSPAIVFGLLACVLFVTIEPAPAHHAFSAEFDINQPIKLSGTVTKIEWQNPHTWFYIDVKDESGKVTNWGLEMGSPNLLIRAGWGRSSMKIGDVVNIEGYRAKVALPLANAQLVTLTTTGQKLFASPGQSTANR